MRIRCDVKWLITLLAVGIVRCPRGLAFISVSTSGPENCSKNPFGKLQKIDKADKFNSRPNTPTMATMRKIPRRYDSIKGVGPFKGVCYRVGWRSGWGGRSARMSYSHMWCILSDRLPVVPVRLTSGRGMVHWVRMGLCITMLFSLLSLIKMVNLYLMVFCLTAACI